MGKWPNRHHKTPSLKLCQGSLMYAAARVGRFYGHKEMISSIERLQHRLLNPKDDLRVVIDIMYMEEIT